MMRCVQCDRPAPKLNIVYGLERTPLGDYSFRYGGYSFCDSTCMLAFLEDPEKLDALVASTARELRAELGLYAAEREAERE